VKPTKKRHIALNACLLH